MRKLSIASSIIGAVVVSAILAGCSSDPNSPTASGSRSGPYGHPTPGSGGSTSDEAPGGSTEQLFSVTDVTIRADGTEDVKVAFYTRQEMATHDANALAQRTGVRAPTPTVDGEPIGNETQTSVDSCSDGSALWMFDQTGCSTGNELCIKGAGTFNLRGQCRVWVGDLCTAYWGEAVRSFWAGTENGYYQDPRICAPTCSQPCENFSSGGSCQSADGTVQDAITVGLEASCP